MPHAILPASPRKTGARKAFGFLLLTTCVALAATQAPAHADITRRGVSASGVDDLLEATAADQEMAALALRRSASPLLSSVLDGIPSDLTFALRQAVNHDLSPERLTERFHELFAAHSNRQHIQTLVTFYRTPLGLRYAQADRRARPGVRRADSKPRSQTRTRLLEHWMQASWAMRRFETEVVVSATGLGRSLSVLGQGRAARTGELAAPMRSRELHEAVMQHFENTLRDFNDAELGLLVRTEESPSGKWYRRVELDAITQTLEEAFRALEIEAHAVRERLTQRYGKTKTKKVAR